MPIQVKSYQRKTKKGIKVVNSFIRKGDKKKEKQKLIKAGAIGAVAGGLLVGGILKRKELGKLLSTAGQKIKSKFINVAKEEEGNIFKGLGEQVSRNKELESIPISNKTENLINTVKSKTSSVERKGLVKPEIKKAKLINTEKEFIPEEIPDPWTTSSNNTKSKFINVNKSDNISQKLLPPAKNIERYPKINDPWDDVAVTKSKQNNNLINTDKESQKLLAGKEVKSLPPAKETTKVTKAKKRTVRKSKTSKTEKVVQEVKKEQPFIKLDSTQQSRDKVHGKFRSVNRDAYRAVKEDDYKLPYQLDKKLVTDKNLLDMAKSSDISDRQRANEIFKDLNKKRNEARKALINAKNRLEKTSYKIDKTKTKLNLNEKEKQIKNLIDTNLERIQKDKKKYLYDLETSQKQKLSQKAGRFFAKTQNVKRKAEKATLGKVDASRRQFLTLGIPDAVKKASETAKEALDSETSKKVQQGLNDLKKAVKNKSKSAQNKSDEAKKFIETAKKESEKLINTGKSKVDEVQEKVNEGLKTVSESQERLKRTVKKKLEEKGIINDRLKPSPFISKIGKNLIETGKKEADKMGKIEALSQIDPRLGRGFAIIDDVKGRIKQVERYADELEKNGDKIVGRRKFFVDAGKKAIIESSKKPKDAYYVGKGTVSKSQEAMRKLVRGKTPRQMQDIRITALGNAYAKDIGQPLTLAEKLFTVKNPLFQTWRTEIKDYRPARGLLERASQIARRFGRYKMGDAKAIYRSSWKDPRLDEPYYRISDIRKAFNNTKKLK